MFVRTSMAGAAIALAGCAGGLNLPPLASAGGVQSMALLGGDFIAAGPNGYCVDPNGSRPKQGFAIMAPCSILGIADDKLRVHAVTTLQVGAAGSAIVAENVEGFAAYLSGVNGPSILSRTGDPDLVTIGDVTPRSNFVTVSLVDAAPAAIDGVQEAEWRAFVDVAGRLVTIAVRGLDEAPLSDPAGFALLNQSVTAVVRANQVQVPSDS